MKVLIIDPAKNTIEIDLKPNDFKAFFKSEIDVNKIIRHQTLKELDKEVNAFIKAGGR